MAFPQGSIPGIDVSHFQGMVDWSTVAAGGEVFAFAKASDGASAGGVDHFFHDNWLGMKAAGLLRGAYHFYRALENPAQQAANFLQALTSANGSAVLAPGDLPAVLDLEITQGVPAATILAGAQTWLNTVANASGRTPILYTGPGFWSQIGNPTALSQYPLWLAQYGPKASKIGGWATWTFWQFSSTSTIGGVSGQVDADAFQGTIADLNALAGL